ncbi:MAG: hypothetical protein WD315_01110 [Balneolaceae bacterium]
MSEETIWIFLLNIASSLVLTGAIWMVQLNGYNALARIHREDFKKHHRSLAGRALLLILPLMVLELVTSIYLVIYTETLLLYHLTGLIMVIAIWISTLLLHLPMQLRLHKGFDEELVHKLRDTNWLRVILWSSKSVISLQVLLEWMT